MTFLDSSVIVRRYGTRVRSRRSAPTAASGDEGSCVSDLVQVEVLSAIHRRVRDGSLDAHRAMAVLDAFASDLPGWYRMPVDDLVLRTAASLVARHPLRTLDAIHLASAIVLRDESPVAPIFASADARLSAAARAEGFEVVSA